MFLTSSPNYVLVFIRLHPTTLHSARICAQLESEGRNALKADTNNLNEVQQCCFFIKTPKQLRDDVILLC